MKKDTPTFYGGQAVMEGVMMRGKTVSAMAVRRADGRLEIITKQLPDKTQKRPWLKWPVLRGMAAFVDAMVTGMRALTQSAEIAADGLEAEEAPSRFELFLQRKLGDRVNNVLMSVSMVLAIALAVLLFVLLPLWAGQALTWLLGTHLHWLGLLEGVTRLLIFLGYVLIISRLKDIRRFFQYHGAEHKTINGHEQGAPLTPESIAAFSRLHNRCGTSFLLVVMFISIVVFTLLRIQDPWLRLGSRLLLIPVVAGLSYEVIRWAGRSHSPLVKIISFPGLCLQRLTTGEPDTPQIETAIAALQAVLDAESAEKAEACGAAPPEAEAEAPVGRDAVLETGDRKLETGEGHGIPPLAPVGRDAPARRGLETGAHRDFAGGAAPHLNK